jgi:hypothetical protein
LFPNFANSDRIAPFAMPVNSMVVAAPDSQFAFVPHSTLIATYPTFVSLWLTFSKSVVGGGSSFLRRIGERGRSSSKMVLRCGSRSILTVD